MALDPEVSSQMASMIVASTKLIGDTILSSNLNLQQGLGVIQNTLIQGNATPQQDAALRTAIHVPAADGIATALPK